jgi:hypothetical protein
MVNKISNLTVTSCNFVNVPKNGFQQSFKFPKIEADEHQTKHRLWLRDVSSEMCLGCLDIAVRHALKYVSQQWVVIVFNILCRGKW